MFDRLYNEEKNALYKVRDSAVRLAKLGNGAIGNGNASSISTVTTSETTADAEGNTLEPRMMWGDKWGSNWSDGS